MINELLAAANTGGFSMVIYIYIYIYRRVGVIVLKSFV